MGGERMFRGNAVGRATRAARFDNPRMSHFDVKLYVHLVWSTKGRVPFVLDRFAPRLHRRIAAIAERERCLALAVGGIADHVHLLLSLHPAMAVSTLVRILKANTSQWVSCELRAPDFAWQEGYGAFSLRECELDTVRHYVIHQPEHHATGTTVLEWELPSPPHHAATPRNPSWG